MVFAVSRASITAAKNPSVSEVVAAAERISGDAEMVKYAERLRQKLKTAVQTD